MKVLLVNGGPHREGCTCTALSEAAATLCAVRAVGIEPPVREEPVLTDFIR